MEGFNSTIVVPLSDVFKVIVESLLVTTFMFDSLSNIIRNLLLLSLFMLLIFKSFFGLSIEKSLDSKLLFLSVSCILESSCLILLILLKAF